ncbi:MAG: efflux RND transporter permease subunit [Nannocystaceae bacterium]
MAVLGGWIAGSVNRPVTTTMATLAVLVFGLVALLRLPVALLPDLSYPSLTVQTEYPDAAPTEVEELVTRPIEELVGAVPGLVQVESVSREGRSEVVLDFAWGTGIDRAMDDVREKLDRVVLPQEAERPVVLRYDPAQEPILRLALVSGQSARGPPKAGADAAAPAGDPGEVHVDLAALRQRADRQVKRALEKVYGVAAVQLHGGDEDEVRVEVDPARLAALGLGADEIVAAVTADNINRPGGALSEQRSRYLIRTVHEAKSPEALGETILRSQDGAELRLRDVATIVRAPMEREELALVDGREAIELAVYREGDANTVAVADAVRDALGRLQLEPGEEVVILSNQADFIASAIAEVRENVLIGGALAVLVLLFFLRDLRATLVIAVTIPISVLATFVPLQTLGVSLNLMSLGGLALGVGMLVDNAIVVLEAIARIREAHPELGARRAAIDGTREVAPSVVAATLTTVAVFLPIAFVEGIAGQLVRDLSYAVSLSIVSSMIVSLTLVPVLQSLGDGAAERRAAAESGAEPPKTLISWLVVPFALVWVLLRAIVRVLSRVLGALARPFSWAYDGVERLYPYVLRGALKARVGVIAAAVVLCVVAVLQGERLGRTLLPELDQGEVYVQITLPQGAALERTTALTRRLLQTVRGDPAVERAFARVGSVTAAGSATGSIAGTHLAQINLRLNPAIEAEEEPAVVDALFTRLAEATYDPEAALQLGRPALFSVDAPIEIRIFAEEPSAARDHALRLLPDLRGIDGLADVTPDDLSGRPEVRVRFDRERLGRLGLDVAVASSAVQRSIQGEIATKLHAADRQLDVRVQYPRVDRNNVDDVGRIQVGVNSGIPVLLSAVADLEPTVGPAEIRRIEGSRGLRIRARLTSSDLGGVAAQVQEILRDHAGDDPLVTTEIAGQAEEMGASLESLGFTAILSIFLIYVVMASSFESLHHPFLIMFTVPLAIAGALLACALTGTPLSAIVGMGVIILGGIVVNNAIVLINTVNHRRGQGHSVQESLEIAGALRLRPILMTTATTVLGLVPMALGFGDGAALRQPLAVAVIGGLVLATLLTLVVIPCVYSLVPGRRRDAWAELAGEGDLPPQPEALKGTPADAGKAAPPPTRATSEPASDLPSALPDALKGATPEPAGAGKAAPPTRAPSEPASDLPAPNDAREGAATPESDAGEATSDLASPTRATSEPASDLPRALPDAREGAATPESDAGEATSDPASPTHAPNGGAATPEPAGARETDPASEPGDDATAREET